MKRYLKHNADSIRLLSESKQKDICWLALIAEEFAESPTSSMFQFIVWSNIRMLTKEAILDTEQLSQTGFDDWINIQNAALSGSKSSWLLDALSIAAKCNTQLHFLELMVKICAHADLEIGMAMTRKRTLH
jgi:beta-lactamase class D